MNALLKKAMAIAVKAHRGQKRKFTGEPYIVHPRRVAERLSDEDDKIVAWLHDVLEDTDVTVEELNKIFPQVTVVGIVQELTHRKDESYYNYILRLKMGSTNAIRVKLADLDDNMSDLKSGALKDKYELAHHILWTEQFRRKF